MSTNTRTGALIRRNTVEVGGKRVDDIDRDQLICVVPTGFSCERLRTCLLDAGYTLGTEWIDGTGTLTIMAREGEQS